MNFRHLLSSGANSRSSNGQLGSYRRSRISPSREGSKDLSEQILPEDFKQRLLTYSRGQSNGINDLPSVILADIISRLPVKSILACRVVCKKLHRLARDPDFIKLHLTRSENSEPRFLFQPLLETVDHLGLLGGVGESVVLNRNWQIPVTNMICRNSTVMCSYNGLVCMALKDGKANPLCIYNPITRVLLELPKSGHRRVLSDYVVALGSDANGRYKIVRHYTAKHGKKESRLEILSLGQSSWRQLSVPEPKWYAHKSMLHNGTVFFIMMMKKFRDKKMSITAIDLNDESMQIIPFGEGLPIHTHNFELLVVEGRVKVMENSKKSKNIWVISGNKTGEISLHVERFTDRYRCRMECCRHCILYTLEGEKVLYIKAVDHLCFLVSYSIHDRPPGHDLPPKGIDYKMFKFKPSFVDPVADALLSWHAK